jgi:hypothetical protein
MHIKYLFGLACRQWFAVPLASDRLPLLRTALPGSDTGSRISRPDLGDLRGPANGIVELPLWLYWSGPSPAFDLAGVRQAWEELHLALRSAAAA